MNIRIGHGIDIHRLDNNIPLILGGVKVPSSFGIRGHSDGDILIHAVVDALLGSLGLGDIGTYFPSDNVKWKNCKSEVFLKDALEKIKDSKYQISNIDTNIILQTPYLNSHINLIKKNLGLLMSLKTNQISIKATTSDRLGFIGQKKGIVATATVLIYRDINESSH